MALSFATLIHLGNPLERDVEMLMHYAYACVNLQNCTKTKFWPFVSNPVMFCFVLKIVMPYVKI